MSNQRRIANGVEIIKEALSDKKQFTLDSRWQDIKNKLDSILTSSNAMKSNEALVHCAKLNTMGHDERTKFINERWGSQCLGKVAPMLAQLHQIESESD